MMRAMREITKPVFWVVAISFIGWLAYGQVTDFIAGGRDVVLKVDGEIVRSQPFQLQYQAALEQYRHQQGGARDRKSTRLNSSHLVISYAVFCLKKKKQKATNSRSRRTRRRDVGP